MMERSVYEENAEAMRAKVIELLQSSPTAIASSKWIPVTERLPEEPLQTVLVTNGKLVCVGVYSVDYEEFVVMCVKGRGEGKRFGVTHWMPLPEPPKGE